MNERHVYIVPGVSREAFSEVGYRETSKDSDLFYYVHGHRHDPYGGVPCNDECTFIHMGELHSVTQLDVVIPTVELLE